MSSSLEGDDSIQVIPWRPCVSPIRVRTKRKTQDPSEEREGTGITVWDCSRVLWHLITAPDGQYAVKGKRIIELGAGTGVLSIACMKAGALEVISTDLPCHLEQLRANAVLNEVAQGFRVSQLRWGEDVAAFHPPFDYVFLSELLYWPSLDILEDDTLEPLVHTVASLLGTRGTAIIAYKTREAAREERFFSLCRSKGFVISPIAFELPSFESSEEPGSECINVCEMRLP